jgi:ssDNA thymidine ADP-ribosyltransferase, DarT
MPKSIYHITHINNLESIVKADGLLAYNAIYEKDSHSLVLLNSKDIYHLQFKFTQFVILESDKHKIL